MSILKGILHHWNKTNSAYDTIHPETESAQITDWHSGIMSSLASKTLGTVVDAITTDSVLGKLIKMLLNASGVKYLIDTNGYICFGSFFGGLIIQWVHYDSTLRTYTLPITMRRLFWHGIDYGYCYGYSTDERPYSVSFNAFDTNGTLRTSNVSAFLAVIGVV